MALGRTIFVSEIKQMIMERVEIYQDWGFGQDGFIGGKGRLATRRGAFRPFAAARTAAQKVCGFIDSLYELRLAMEDSITA